MPATASTWRAAEAFGELRALLAGAPSAWRWRFICALLDEAPERAWLDEQAIPYAERALVSWPDALRVAPLDWVRRVVDGQAVPALRLARTLRGMPELVDRRQRTARAPKRYPLPALAHITALDLRVSGELACVTEVLSRMPGVRSLTCLGARVDEGDVGELGVWRQLRHLRLRGIECEGVLRVFRALLDSGAIETLESLDVLMNTGFDSPSPAWSEGLRGLLAGRQWPALRHLHLVPHAHANNPLSELLAGAPALESLGLGGSPTRSSDVLLDIVRRSPCASTLRALHGASILAPQDLRAMLPALESLRLSYCRARQHTTCEGLRELSLSECDPSLGEGLWHDPALTSLEVVRSGAQQEDLARWLRAPQLRRLRVDTASNPLTLTMDGAAQAPLRELILQNVRPARGALQRALEQGPCAESLETLSLEMAGLGPSGARELASCRLPALQRLGLEGNHIGDDGFAALLDAPWFGQLRALLLHHNGLSAEAFELWAIVPRSRIEVLSWAFNARRDDAGAALLSSAALTELRALDLGPRDAASGQLMSALREALPRIWALRLDHAQNEDVQRLASPRLEHLHSYQFDRQLQRHLDYTSLNARVFEVMARKLRGTPWFDTLTHHTPGHTPKLAERWGVDIAPRLDWSRWWEWAAR